MVAPAVELVGTVAVRARHRLVAETVGAALASRGLPAVWAGEAGRGQDLSAGDVLFILDDLVDGHDLLEVMQLVTHTSARCLVLTPVTDPAVLGGLLECGAAGTLSAWVDLDTAAEAVTALLGGREFVPERRRAAAIEDWNRLLARHAEIRDRVARLSLRERTVLSLLYGGHGVSEIAEDLELAEATVRSHIKAILAKLGEHSQLGAVSALHRLEALGPWWAGPPAIPAPRRRGGR